MIELNALIYILIFLFFYKKIKTINLAIFLLGLYAFGSVSSVLFYHHPYFQYSLHSHELKLEPFVYLLITLLLFFWPIIVLREDMFLKLKHPSYEKLYWLIVFIIVCSFVRIYFLVPHAFSMLSSNADLAANKEEMMEGIRHVIIPFPLSTISYCSALLSKISILIFFYMITYFRREKLLNFFLGIAVFVPEILNGVSATSRAYLFFFVINVLVCVLLFKKQMAKNTLKIIKLFGFLILSGLVIFVSAITILRFSDQENVGILGDADITFFLYKYFGESFLNFNGILYDNIDSIMYGDRNFSFFKNILGLNNIETLIELREAGEKITGVPNYIFYQFVGQLYLDFGKIGTLFIGIFSCFFGARFFKFHPSYPFSKLILLILYYRMCIQGFFFYPFTLQTGNLQIVVHILIYFYFRIGNDNGTFSGFNYKGKLIKFNKGGF